MSKVSVIIPLYNKSKYIARALDSVFVQTYRDFEVIVVDDGSTDDGPEIVKGYSDPRIRLIYQVNAGPGAARNRGAEESMGPWLAFLDADDELLPDFLKLLQRASHQYVFRGQSCELQRTRQRSAASETACDTRSGRS